MNKTYQLHLNSILEASYSKAVKEISSNMGMKDREELLIQIDYIIGKSPDILKTLLLEEFRKYGWSV